MLKNIIANFLGTFWSLISSFLFIPLYIRFLGFESYSIISFSLILTGFISILETGVTSTLSREFARSDNTWINKIELFNALERFYILIIFGLGIIFSISAPYISTLFIKSKQFNVNEIAFFLRIFSIDLFFSLLIRFYLGAYIGLQKQVRVNKLIIFWGVVRNGLVVLVIYFYPSIVMFYFWQSICTFLFFLWFRYSLNKEIFDKRGFVSLKRINISLLKPRFRFALGIIFISLVSSVSTLFDRVLISHMFEIKYLGYYTLATSLSSAVYFLTKPVSVAILPFFTNLVTSNKEDQLQKTFYNVSFITSALTFAVCSNIFYFSNEIIYIWTRSADLASNASIYLKILVLGYSVSSLQHLSYDVAIANGNTKINNILGIASLIILLPSYWFAVGRFGPEGVAVVFLIVQTILTIIFISTINNIYLDKSRNFRNLINAFIIPFFISFIFSGIIYFFSKKLLFSNYILSILICGISTFFCFVFLIFCFDKISELKRIVNSMPVLNKTHFKD